jgi:WS/DGAT/MGAT family acyltransferase
MDRPTNPMVIHGVVVLDGRCTLARLRRVVRTRFLAHARFTRVPLAETIGGSWHEDPDFDLKAHVGTVSLARGADQDALEALIGRLAGEPLEARRPRWRIDLVPHYGGGSAVVFRIHHCYADGIALVRVILSLTTPTPGGEPLAEPLPEAPAADPDLGLLPVLRWVGAAIPGGSTLVETALRWLGHPLEALGEVRDAAAIAAEVKRLLALADDPPGPLRGPLGATKRVAWAPPVPLAEVRTIAHALGCTINDVLMSVVAGTIDRYLESVGDAARGQSLRAALPVNLRREGAPPLGNRFGLVLLPLPVGIAHPFERLYAVQAAMRTLKDSRQPVAVLATLAALGHVPAAAEDLAVETLSRKASMVISNVPGPRETIYLCGQRVRDMHFWVPQSGSIGLGISVLSYAGDVHFGVIADAALVPDPHALVDAFGPEFERLLLLTVLGAAVS